MRLIISFVLASGLLIAGIYLLLLELLVARIVMGRALLMGCLLAAVGAGWLWADFIGPLIRGQKIG